MNSLKAVGTLAAALALGGVSRAQGTPGISLFQGSAGQPGDVLVLDPEHLHAPALAPASLQDIVLLPIEIHGRLEIQELSLGAHKRRTDVPGAARIELANGVGSLYRYARPGASGDAYGFMLIDASGVARSVWELAVEPAAADPLIDRIAIADDGAAILVATTVAAGGDLIEIELSSGRASARTASTPPLAFGSAGLALSVQWGVAVHASGVLRFDRTTGAQAAALSFPGATPPYFARQLALSGNGDFAITIAGASASSADVYAFARTGQAVRASTTPASVSAAGFAPDAIDGPYLAISDDGSTCAWRTEGASREAFLAHVHPPGGETPEQLTSDQRFTDTLDEVGIYSFRPLSNTFVMGVGEQAEPGATEMDDLDFFAVDFAAGGTPQFTNLSLSSGDGTVPFLSPPTLKPEGLRWVEDAGAWFFLDRDSEQLLAVDDASGSAQVLLSDVKSLDLSAAVAGEIVFAIRGETDPDPTLVYRVTAALDQPPVLIAQFDHGDEVQRPAVRADGWIAFIQVQSASERAWMYGVASSQLKLLTTRPLTYGATQAFAPTGELFLGVGAPGAPSLFAEWPVSGPPHRVPLAPVPGFVLPGV